MFLLVTHTESGFWEFLKRYYQNNSYSKKKGDFPSMQCSFIPDKGESGWGCDAILWLLWAIRLGI